MNEGTSSRALLAPNLLRSIATVFALVALSYASSVFFVGGRNDVEISFNVKASSGGLIQFFFDIGRGFNETDSVHVLLAATSAFEHHAIPVDASSIGALRIDPPSGVVFLSELKVRIGTRTVSLSDHDLVPVNEIKSISIEDHVVRIETTGHAVDPILQVKSLDQSSPLGPLEPEPERIIIWMLIWSLCLVGLRLLRNRVVADVASVSSARRLAFVLLAALVGALLSCFSVVFLGASFVSPGNGPVVLLYDTCPTVPTHYDCSIERTPNSDVGAMAWSFIPTVVAQERAIRSGEFPLWNRYNSAGVTMIGQGQSLLGDPFTWLQWLVGVDSWNFDLKFVILRIMFATSLAATVYVATQSVAGAALIGFAAPLVGFFFYRVDHPAVYSMCLAPLVPLAWVWFSHLRTSGRSVAWGSVAVFVSSWLLSQSGTAKEAYIATIILNGAGFVYFCLRKHSDPQFRPALLILLATGIAFCAAVSPFVGTFLASLKEGYTLYDAPHVNQMAPWELLGFSDSIFRLLSSGDLFVSVNLLIFWLSLFALYSAQTVSNKLFHYTLWCTNLLLYCMAFGVIPADVIKQIPFIRNIIHIHNTFSFVAVVTVSLSAGMGFATFYQMRGLGKPALRPAALSALSLVGLLILYYVYFPNSADRLGWPFLMYGGITILAATVLPFMLARIAKRPPSHLLMIGTVVMAFLILGRGASLPDVLIDAAYFEPRERVSLVAESEMIEALKKATTAEPSRVIGVENTLIPGFNQLLGIETISGPDAVMVRSYRELIAALELPDRGWMWRLILAVEDVERYSRALDFLGVRFVLSSTPVHSLSLLASDRQASAYERTSAWPRAFFAPWVERVPDVAALGARVASGAPGPFVSISSQDAAAMQEVASLPVTGSGTAIVPAFDYDLRANSTAFSVTANAPGLAYLGEADIPGDFLVYLDGKPTKILRANHAFKAVYIDTPGEHRIEFRYWPRNLEIYLAIAAAGTVAWLLILFFIARSSRVSRESAPA